MLVFYYCRLPAPWHSRTRGSHALEWITPWPTEPVRFTGVTDVVIPAVHSWPDHDAAKVANRPIVRHGVTMRPGEPGFGLVTADATIQGAPGYLWP